MTSYGSRGLALLAVLSLIPSDCIGVKIRPGFAWPYLYLLFDI